jgi:hypothetical protein
MKSGPRRRGNADRGPDHEERALPMADENPTGPGAAGCPTTADEDAREERRVLREVLTVYPESLRLEELIRELTVGSSAFSDQDAIERAVRDLIAVGLIHQVGDLVLPTRPAVIFYALIQDGEV